jgi:hypothetical protein
MKRLVSVLASGAVVTAVVVAATAAAVKPAAADSGSTSPACGTNSITTIRSNFNGTSIPGGSTIWFSANGSIKGVPSTGGTVTFDSSIQIPDLGTSYTVPSGTITFSPSATEATTTFDAGSNTWNTTVPLDAGGNVFLTGFALPVPAGGFPGGINPVIWKGQFSSSTPGVSISWKWGAAVYTQFPTDMTQLEVKPIDGGTNSHHAGTPENFRQFVIGGGRGGGGSNWTGSWSGTAGVKTCIPAAISLAYADSYEPRSDNLPTPWVGGVTKFVGCGSTMTGIAGTPGSASDPCLTFTDASGTLKDQYDAGAIMIVNNGTDTLTVTDSSVVEGPCAYNPWPGLNVTLAPGESVILTQTGTTTGPTPGGALCPGVAEVGPGFDLDTTEAGGNGHCTDSGYTPVITLTLNGVTETIVDTDRILNHQGVDVGACPPGTNGTTEFQNWTPIT